MALQRQEREQKERIDEIVEKGRNRPMLLNSSKSGKGGSNLEKLKTTMRMLEAMSENSNTMNATQNWDI